MVNLFPTILYSCMVGMALLALVEAFKREHSKQNTSLIVLLLLLEVHLLGELFIYSGAFVYAPGLAGLQQPFSVLLGPALYMYGHASMSAQQNVNPKLKALAWFAPVGVTIVMLPFLFLITPEQKLALATPATRDPELWKIAVLTCLSTTFIFLLYTALYLFMALKLHRAHKLQLMDKFSEIEQCSLDWFRKVLLIWGAAWSLFAIEFSLKALGWVWFGTGKLLPILEMLALAFFMQNALSQKVLKRSEKGEPRSSKSRVAILSDDRMQAIAEKLKRAMSEDKLFLQDNLSLNKLAEAVEETENHISETLSQFLHSNFFNFVNGFRIDAAKIALSNRDKLVTSIAYDVGFNSKSTFNAAFKKYVGQSPSHYRKQLSDNQ